MARMAIGQRQRKKIWLTTQGRCWFCGRKTVYSSHSPVRPADFTIDHIIPITKTNGEHLDNNLVPCCWRCNKIKGDNDLEIFRELLGYTIQQWPKFKISQRRFLNQHGIELPKSGIKFWFETGHPLYKE